MSVKEAAIFGLTDSEVADLVQGISPAEVKQPATEVFARAAWTVIAEPGDRVAHKVIESMGAASALKSWLEHCLSDDLVKDWAGMVEESELREAAARWFPRTVAGNVVGAIKLADRCGAKLLTPDDPIWPKGLSDMGDEEPVALWYRGSRDVIASLQKSICVTGARAATGYGEHVAIDAVDGLVGKDFTVVAGAAYGIEGTVHQVAMNAHGRTVAILAGGVDRFYPSGHDTLLGRVVEFGAVFSELPCGASPTKWRFLKRNRLEAAVTQATVVVEAGWRSGSLNTAGHAIELGRPLGAVPGPVTSAASAGCHRLLREFSATCVTTAAEMAELVDID